MSPLFGKKTAPTTVAIIDIESGSIGSGLVEISGTHKPRLMGQERRILHIRGTPSASLLLKEIEREMEDSLVRLSGIASRMGNYRGAPGDIGRVAVFLHAPWASVSIGPERAKADAHDATLDALRTVSSGVLSTTPASFHAFSTTATPIIHGLFNAPRESLVVSIGGEIAELSLLKGGTMVGHATMPLGLHTVLRTLESHAGLSRAEALSVLSLSRSTHEHAWAEALSSGVAQISRELSGTVASMLPDSKHAQQIFILAPKQSSDFFARAFTEDASLHELFAPGSTIRAVLPRHATPHLLGHPSQPDLPLLLESLFVDTRFGA
jgi:hypothetical protein